MNNADKPAYPMWTDDMPIEGTDGLTKRERLAMAAMQGMISDMHHNDNNLPNQIAHDAVNYADALLKELEETNDTTR